MSDTWARTGVRWMQVRFGVLGSVAAWDGADRPLALRGPRHRAVLARLVAARGRIVTVDRLVDDLWERPPEGAVSAVRTFVAALRRAIEPDRAPRTPPRLLVTDGPGYALRPGPDAVDAWRFETAVADTASTPAAALTRLDAALGWWRGPAYADLDDRPWIGAERRRLDQLRSVAVDRRAEALIALGRAAEAAASLEEHTADHPLREEAWRLLALALYRDGRQAEALAVLRRATGLLRERFGLDPGGRLLALEADLLRRTGPAAESGGTEALWGDVSAAFTATGSVGERSRLESAVGLIRGLALTGPGGLTAAAEQREAAIEAAEALGDSELTARVIGAYDVPAIWTRSDDPARAARVVAAAERTLGALGEEAGRSVRARLLATVAVESRGTGSAHGAAAARESERIARELGDPSLLAFALNGVFLHRFDRAGLASERDAIGAELAALAHRHDLPSFGILGRLIRMQARAALADFPGADEHAGAAEALAERHERPLVAVFTEGYRAVWAAATGAGFSAAEAAYRVAAQGLQGSGMPGVERGLGALALLCLRVQHGLPADFDDRTDWGPYRPWALPLVLLARGGREAAAEALRRAPEPPGDLMLETMWTLTARAAIELGDLAVLRRARAALASAAQELAGAGSGMVNAGPVSRHLDDVDAAIAALS